MDVEKSVESNTSDKMSVDTKMKIMSSDGSLEESEVLTESERQRMIKKLAVWTEEEDRVIIERLKECSPLDDDTNDTEKSTNHLKNISELFIRFPQKSIQQIIMRMKFIELNQKNREMNKTEVTWENYCIKSFIEMSKRHNVSLQGARVLSPKDKPMRARSNSREARAASPKSMTSFATKSKKLRNSCQYLVDGTDGAQNNAKASTNTRKLRKSSQLSPNDESIRAIGVHQIRNLSFGSEQSKSQGRLNNAKVRSCQLFSVNFDTMNRNIANNNNRIRGVNDKMRKRMSVMTDCLNEPTPIENWTNISSNAIGMMNNYYQANSALGVNGSMQNSMASNGYNGNSEQNDQFNSMSVTSGGISMGQQVNTVSPGIQQVNKSNGLVEPRVVQQTKFSAVKIDPIALTEQSIQTALNENYRILEMIQNAVMSGGYVQIQSVNLFQFNIDRLIKLTNDIVKLSGVNTSLPAFDGIVHMCIDVLNQYQTIQSQIIQQQSNGQQMNNGQTALHQMNAMNPYA